MKSLIFGYGITGQSFERYLNKKGIDFEIYDEEITGPNITNTLPNKEKLQSLEMVYLSPGINLKKIYPKGEFDQISYLTDLDIFFQDDSSYKIGVTGTNGKSTCCYHLHQILDDSQLIGNIGKPVLDSINSCAYSIIELSSFQLEKVHEIQLDFGVLLNIAPDHIDHHGTLAEYTRVKNRIKESKKSIEESDPKKLWSIIMGMNNRVVRDIQFTDLPHRLESMNGSKWLKHLINDSKATNLAALEYALNKMDDSYFLILCGDPNKEQYKNYKIIGPEKIFIFGSYAAEIYKRISHPNKMLLHNQDLLSVMNKIRSDKSFPYIRTILFSPGHPSGNDYKNFEQRGDHFKQLVREICVD
jgi:UDP-N-acetylmuramoylalanine-D-glutamate ligase